MRDAGVVGILIVGLMLVDTLIVAYAVHRIYHSIFHVFYFSFRAIITELIAIAFIAVFIVLLPCGYLVENFTAGQNSAGGLAVGLVYSAIFLAVCIFIIKKFSKKNRAGSDTQ